MQYLVLIYEAESVAKDMSKEARGEMHKQYFALGKDPVLSKWMKGGEALESVTTATTVRTRGGKTTTTDGPFAETREQLGGYYLIDVKNLDEALTFAKRIPAAATGSVEVRPITVFEAPKA